ncbi:MAG: ATP-binding protein [Bacteroidetes bacterium]|nr:ATP-binding protein [Bacteroidota bacterium]MBU1717868.1 ATP-binding protein [Bacteroidota bacterium]
MTGNIKIAIASGKGGTGKTLVSTNLFYLLQQQGYVVTLVDCDAEEPNAMVFFDGKVEKTNDIKQKIPVIDASKCTFCGKCHEYCNYNAIFLLPESEIISVIEDLCHGCGACSVACNAGAISEKDVSLGIVTSFRVSEKSKIIEARMKVGVYSPVSIIKEANKEAGNHGIIIMDSPPGTSCPFIQTVSTADYVILVTEPTPFGLSDLKQSVNTLKTMSKSYGVIINRAGLGDKAIYSYLQQESIPLLLEIPFDKTIASAYSRGKIVLEHNPQLLQSFATMLTAILEKYGNRHNQR